MKPEITVLAAPDNAPIRIVIANDARQANPECRRELEVENDVRVDLQPVNERLLHGRVLLHEVIQSEFVRRNRFLLRIPPRRRKEFLQVQWVVAAADLE